MLCLESISRNYNFTGIGCGLGIGDFLKLPRGAYVQQSVQKTGIYI